MEAGIRPFQAECEADVLIVDTAMEIPETTAVGIVGEDVDFIVLLIAKANAHKDIIFIKPGRGKIMDSFFWLLVPELQKQGFKDMLFFTPFSTPHSEKVRSYLQSYIYKLYRIF